MATAVTSPVSRWNRNPLWRRLFAIIPAVGCWLGWWRIQFDWVLQFRANWSEMCCRSTAAAAVTFARRIDAFPRLQSIESPRVRHLFCRPEKSIAANTTSKGSQRTKDPIQLTLIAARPRLSLIQFYVIVNFFIIIQLFFFIQSQVVHFDRLFV